MDTRKEIELNKYLKKTPLKELPSILREISDSVESTQRQIKIITSYNQNFDFFNRSEGSLSFFSTTTANDHLTEYKEKLKMENSAKNLVQAEIDSRILSLDLTNENHLEFVLELDKDGIALLKINPRVFNIFGRYQIFTLNKDSLNYIPQLALFASQPSFPIKTIEFTDSSLITLQKHIDPKHLQALMLNTESLSFANFHPDNDCLTFLSEIRSNLGDRYLIKKIHIENITLNDMTLLQSTLGPLTNEISLKKTRISASVASFIVESVKNNEIASLTIDDTCITERLKHITKVIYELKNKTLKNYADIETARQNLILIESLLPGLIKIDDKSTLDNADTYILDNKIKDLCLSALLHETNINTRKSLAINLIQSSSMLDLDFTTLTLGSEFSVLLDFKRIISKFNTIIAMPDANLYILKNTLDEAEIKCTDDESKKILANCKQELFDKFCTIDPLSAIAIGKYYKLELTRAYQAYNKKLFDEINSNKKFSDEDFLNICELLIEANNTQTPEALKISCITTILTGAKKVESKKEIILACELLKKLPPHQQFVGQANDLIIELTKKRIETLVTDHPQISTLPILINNTNVATDLDTINAKLNDYIVKFSLFNKIFMKKLIEDIKSIQDDISLLRITFENNKKIRPASLLSLPEEDKNELYLPSAPSLNDHGVAIAAASAPPLNDGEDEDDLPAIEADDAAFHEEFSKPIPGLLANLSLLTRKIDLNTMSADEIDKLFPKIPKQEGLRGTAASVPLRS